MGIREYDHDGYGIFIENERKKEEIETQKLALQKNNEELNRICKNICLFIGWILVLVLFIWVIVLYTFGH